MKQVHSGDPRIANVDLEAMRFGYTDPVLASLQSLPAMLDAISDLHGHLLVSTTNDFITSDNPAFKYNQYCEEVQHMGITGALCSGLQIFLPLTPQLHLLLYDPATYKVRRSERYSRRSTATVGAPVPRRRGYRQAKLPRAIAWSDVERVLAAVDRRTPVGRRDYAILLLLATYGLRAREVAALRLDDVDWARAQLHVTARKNGHSTMYPLATTAGHALVDYLKAGRPLVADDTSSSEPWRRSRRSRLMRLRAAPATTCMRPASKRRVQAHTRFGTRASSAWSKRTCRSRSLAITSGTEAPTRHRCMAKSRCICCASSRSATARRRYDGRLDGVSQSAR